jgi:23S rRNA (uridine2552-2'-O)-methyltransferase
MVASRMPRYDPRDRFFRKAKAEGLRARSAYKLEEIQRRWRLIRPGARVLDLGAAPGGWLQIAAREVGERGYVLGIDLEPIPRVAGLVETWVADALAPGLAERLRSEGRAPYDVVLSDLAPRTSGVRDADEAHSLELAERALGLSLEVLHPAGSFVVKVFMGGGFDGFLRTCKASFSTVRVARPEPSVARRSREVYVVGTRLRTPRESGAGGGSGTAS